jgi:hypothetical protein
MKIVCVGTNLLICLLVKAAKPAKMPCKENMMPIVVAFSPIDCSYKAIDGSRYIVSTIPNSRPANALTDLKFRRI